MLGPGMRISTIDATTKAPRDAVGTMSRSVAPCIMDRLSVRFRAPGDHPPRPTGWRESEARASFDRKKRNMAPKKKVTGLIKLQINAGAANPAPPIGPALGQHGVNIMEFCKAYNAATESQRGNVIPVEITVYEDRSFTFILKTPPAAELIKKAAGVGKGSATPHTSKVGKLTREQV